MCYLLKYFLIILVVLLSLTATNFINLNGTPVYFLHCKIPFLPYMWSKVHRFYGIDDLLKKVTFPQSAKKKQNISATTRCRTIQLLMF